jgi:hypothetical protein
LAITNGGEISGLREPVKLKICATNLISNRAVPSFAFIYLISQQEFGDDVGDARTTKFLRRDNSVCAARKRGLNRLCSKRGINRVTKKPENTEPSRASAKSKIAVSPIS